jgi:hypothetical protein
MVLENARIGTTDRDDCRLLAVLHGIESILELLGVIGVSLQ